MQKLYRFEVDQSIRIEELARDTIIGIANQEQQFTLIVPSRVKRRVRETFRRSGKPKLAGPYIFAASVVCAVKKAHFRLHDLIIDKEYSGHEEHITKIINSAFPELSVYFDLIGKSSPAHAAAYFTHKKQSKPNASASAKELQEILKQKDGQRTVTPRVYTDSQPN